MHTKKKNQVMQLVLTGLLTAFVTISTMMISIPTPTKGYINLGDCFVNISAWLLGPVYGSFAAGVGSALADLFLGYTIYAPATFVIKGLMALVSCLVFRLISQRIHGLFARIAASVAAEIVMVVGYCLFESVLYQSFAAAVVGVPANLAQGVGGVIFSVVVYEALLSRIPFFKAHSNS